jgi:HAD superfamily hydrolase (TIGR01490 family)
VKKKEGKEVQEEQEVKERHGGAAAFFDLDGTLLAGPSLERQLFRELRWRGAIAARNYFFWMAEALRVAPRGIQRILQGNKMYLKGVAVNLAEAAAAKRGLRFYREGIARVEWHAGQGHAIYLVSGTLEELASRAALALVVRLAARGVTAKIGFCATRLEEVGGRWTGRVEGMAMFGEEKERAVRRIAKQEGFSLEKSYAYGNCVSDRWMLGAVGRATGVNPSAELEKIAWLNGWPVMRWEEEEKSEGSLTQRRGVRREEEEETKRRKEAKTGVEIAAEAIVKESQHAGERRTEVMRMGSRG